MIDVLLYIHILLGVIALVTGGVSILTVKGSKRHILSGKVFYFSLILSVLLSIIVSLLPDHYNPFLMAIGIFTLYLVYSGRRSLAYKRAKKMNFTQDKIAAYIMIFTSLGMIIIPLWWKRSLNMILFTFGLIGIAFAIRDIFLIKHQATLQKQYLSMHIGKMGGAYIATVTAFLVVNDFIPGIWEWFIPTIVGTVFISRAIQKVKQFAG